MRGPAVGEREREDDGVARLRAGEDAEVEVGGGVLQARGEG